MIFTTKEDQYWATRADWTDMAEIIKKMWDEGYAITDMTYGDEAYYVLMEKETGILAQEYVWNKSFSKALEENKKSSDGMCITSFCCDDTSCCLVRSKFEHSIEQTWCRSTAFPKREIERHWSEGYTISALNWNKGYWRILFSKDLAYAHKESWETTFKPKPLKLNEAFHNEAKMIASLCFGDAKWALSYVQHQGVFSQKVYLGRDFPEKEISEYWSENYNISKAAFGNGLWFFTFNNSYQAEFNMHDRFKELYREKEYSEAILFFKEHLYQSFESPEPIILDYLRCFKHVKRYDDGITAFEHFITLLDNHHEALHIGGDFYYRAYKKDSSEAYLRKALKCFSLISPGTTEIQKKMDKLRSLLPDENVSETAWKQKMARNEQMKRKTDKELKNKKF